MYPKRFTFDPKQIERARLVTLRSPDLNVLRDENRAELPGLAHFLEQGFKARDAEGKLLLPDLSALANRTVASLATMAARIRQAVSSPIPFWFVPSVP